DVPLNWQSKGTDELIILLPAIQAHVEFLEPPEEPKQELTHPEQERLLGTSRPAGSITSASPAHSVTSTRKSSKEKHHEHEEEDQVRIPGALNDDEGAVTMQASLSLSLPFPK
ncbi:unnamed protein product, partial [Durusdinium trenchii]